MNKEIEKTLMNGDYESAYRLIQEYRSQKYDYDTFSYLSYYSPELVNMIRHMMCPARLWI